LADALEARVAGRSADGAECGEIGRLRTRRANDEAGAADEAGGQASGSTKGERGAGERGKK